MLTVSPTSIAKGLLLLLSAVAGVALCFSTAWPDPLQTVASHYLETTGEHRKSFQLIQHATAALTLQYQDEEEKDNTWFQTDLSTERWTMEIPSQQTSIVASRQGETMVIEGVLHGQSVHRSHALGRLPWYQALSVSLGAILRNPDENREFWILRSDTLDLHRLQVSDIRATELELAGQTIPAWQLTIRPTGWQTYLWHADYWMRRPDMRFLRYEGVNGPPGSSATIVTLIDESTVTAQSAR